MERYDIEELVLGLADIVRENEYLRQENTRLREVEKEYHQSIIDRCRESEQASLNMFKAACVGIAQGKNDMVLADYESLKNGTKTLANLREHFNDGAKHEFYLGLIDKEPEW